MNFALPKPIHGSLVRTLLCSAAFIASTQVAADDIVIDEFFLGGLNVNSSIVVNINPAFNPTIIPSDGDRIIIDDAISIVVDEQAGIDLFQPGVDNLTIINNGTIYTSGTLTTDQNNGGGGYGDGIFLDSSDNATIINNGEISIGDQFSFGVFTRYSSSLTLTNDGRIEIREDVMKPALDNAGNVVINPDTGLPFMTSVTSAGFRVDSFDSLDNPLGGHLLTNNGEIVSYALQSRGMFIDGGPSGQPLGSVLGSTMINNGNIMMLSNAASNGTYDVSGLRIEGHDGTIINNGYIEVRPQGIGIDYNGANGTVVNTGTIFVYNQNSHGIEHYRNGANTLGEELSFTENHGLIEVYGKNTHGVSLTGHVGHAFFNAGRILSESGYSIEAGGDSLPINAGDTNSIWLWDGSILYGDVFVDAQMAEFTFMLLGDGLNATVKFETGTHMANGRAGDRPIGFASWHDSHVYDAATGTLYVADLDSYAQQDQALWRMSSMLQDAIDAGGGTQLPANTYGFAKNVEGRWTRAFGGGLFAQRDGSAPAYNAGSVGLVTGMESQQRGVHGGLAVSYVDGNEAVSYETTSASFYAGVSGNVENLLNYSFTAGAAYNHTDRDQADNTVAGGIDSTGADYASVFWSPSLRLEGPVKGSSLRLLYTGLWQQGHTFNFPGGTELSVDDRFANFVQSRVQMQHALGGVNLAYGAEASWTHGQNMSFDLMGVGLVTPYDDGFYSRAFTRLQNNNGFFEIGYDTKERATVEAGLKLEF